VINVPRRGLGDSAVELIEIEANRIGKSLLETLDGPDAERFIGQFKAKPRQGLVQFARTMNTIRNMPQFPVAEVMREMLERSGLLAALIDADEKDRVENLEQLVNAAAAFDRDHDPENIVVPAGPPPEPGAFDGAEEMALNDA